MAMTLTPAVHTDAAAMVVTEDYLKLLPYWNKLSKDEKNIILQNAVIRNYKNGAEIYGCRESCLGMIYILKGSIRAYILSEEGREITLFRYGSGDSCVLSSSCVIDQITFDTYMVTESDCEILIVNSSAFGKLTEQNIYVRCYMYEILSERFSSVMWTMQQILFARFDRRLASFLISEYERTGSAEIRMTHEQIAKHVNSAREVVARMMKRFSSDALVELRRGTVILKNIDELKKLT